ncbi:MAG: hypothetical protein CL512_04875 [Actinobacteria bacterium]|mgnify:CR=1 FL=1|nr:hypothetical protein [Actinomycetota bacterium]
METTTPNQTYTKSAPHPLHIDSLIARNKEEGRKFEIHESQNLLTVETTLYQGRKDISIFRRSNGMKITRPDDFKEILHHLIRSGSIVNGYHPNNDAYSKWEKTHS